MPSGTYANLSSAIRVFVLRHMRDLANARQPQQDGERAHASWWSPSTLNTI